MTLGHLPKSTETDVDRLAELIERVRQARADYDYALLALRLFTKTSTYRLEDSGGKV